MARVSITHEDRQVFDGDSAALLSLATRLRKDLEIAMLYGASPNVAMEIAMRSTAKTANAEWRKYRVYGGPHHGRLLEIPAFLSAVVLSGNPLDDGERFATGRTDPSQFRGNNYLYKVTEVRTPGRGYSLDAGLRLGDLYLADQGITSFPVSSGMYRVPKNPGISVSGKAHDLISYVNSVSAEVGNARSDAEVQAKVAKRVPFLRALYTYIAELEDRAGVARTMNIIPR